MTEDKFEMTMAANVFGHALLTDLLIDNILAATEASKDPAR